MENKQDKFKKILFSQVVKSIVYNTMRSTTNTQMANMTIDSLLQFLASELKDQTIFVESANETIENISYEFLKNYGKTITCPHCDSTFENKHLIEGKVCPACGTPIEDLEFNEDKNPDQEIDEEEQADIEIDVNIIYDQLGWEK